MMHSPLRITLAVALLAMGGCDRPARSDLRSPPPPTTTITTPPLTTTRRVALTDAEVHAQTVATFAAMVRVGELRIFGPGGPKFPLPPNYIEFTRAHPFDALELLTERLRSEDGLIRLNAVDFLRELKDVPEVAARVHELLIAGTKDSAWVVSDYAARQLAEGH